MADLFDTSKKHEPLAARMTSKKMQEAANG